MSGWDAAALAAVIGAAVTYASGLRRLWRRAGRGGGVSLLGAVGGAAGWLVLAAALGPPLAAAADRTFAAHMGQHELLMLVAPLLLVLGRPWSAALWALPRRGRLGLRDLLRRPAPSAAWRLATSPAGVLLLQAVPLWLWHAPPAFEAALADDGLHAVQHLTFFAPAALFWWSLVHGRFGRLGYGAGVLFVFATALHSGALGALLAVARAPLYPTHAARAAAAGIDPLGDQQVAGLLMWVPAAIVLTAAALALFAAWLGEAGRRVRWTRTGELAAATTADGEAAAMHLRRRAGERIDEGRTARISERTRSASRERSPDASASRGNGDGDEEVSVDNVCPIAAPGGPFPLGEEQLFLAAVHGAADRAEIAGRTISSAAAARLPRPAARTTRTLLLLVAPYLLATACGEPSSWAAARRLTGGDPARGRQAILDRGCGTCHTIPGVPGADAVVGPSLAGLPGRMSLAGRLANDPDELVRWIRHPQRIEPGTLMPDTGLDEATARDVAAYLYTLD